MQSATSSSFIKQRCEWYRQKKWTYALFLDEAINGKLKKIAAACHSAVFHKRLLAEFRIAHGPESKGRGILDRLKRRTARGELGTSKFLCHRLQTSMTRATVEDSTEALVPTLRTASRGCARVHWHMGCQEEFWLRA